MSLLSLERVFNAAPRVGDRFCCCSDCKAERIGIFNMPRVLLMRSLNQSPGLQMHLPGGEHNPPARILESRASCLSCSRCSRFCGFTSQAATYSGSKQERLYLRLLEHLFVCSPDSLCLRGRSRASITCISLSVCLSLLPPSSRFLFSEARRRPSLPYVSRNIMFE
jgi:hypothetical protein